MSEVSSTGRVTPESPGDAASRLRLEEILKQYRSVAVALSGGVDSGLLLAVARRVLGDAAIAAIGVSPSLAAVELRQARVVASTIGAPLLELPTDELANPSYVSNTGDRCFHCKFELYGVLGTDPRLKNKVLCDGTHAEDDSEDRPGMSAARTRGVRSPLREAGLGKASIRRWARELGLPNWSRPARPCLASRIRVGTSVTPERLAAVESLEEILENEGFGVYRARIREGEVIIEVGVEEIGRLSESQWRRRISERSQQLGYQRVWIDGAGYGSGREFELTPLELGRRPE